MSYLFKNVLIKDHQSEFHNQRKDISVSDGVITAIGDDLSDEFAEEISSDDLHVSAGWVDVGAMVGEPGFEYKEDFDSICKASAVGGFTHVACFPNTNPVVDHVAIARLFTQASIDATVNLIPIPAVTNGAEGRELSEMLDMHHSTGLTVFSDGDNPIFHTGILMKSLQYVQRFDGVVVQKAYDKYLSKDGQVHEGINSTRKGLKGIPSIAEEIEVKKAIDVLSYAGGRLHFSNISTAGAVEAIRDAKSSGLKVTADVSAKHLMFSDEEIASLDTNYKVMPPFRSHSDMQALIKGVQSGIIDMIVTAHRPHEADSKKLEFDLADFGVTGLETFLHELLGVLEIDEFISQITEQPRTLLGLDNPSISLGKKADLTFFDPNKAWELKATTTASKSRNSPFTGQMLRGKVIATVNNTHVNING